MEFYTALTIGVLGLCFGSFLNVLIYRLPLDKPWAASRSVCPTCGKQLRWFHNIPLLSYAFLRGRCGFCKSRISIRYPLVELANSSLYLYFYWQFGLIEQFFVFAFLSSVLLAIFFIDLEHQIIPDIFTLPGIGIGLAVSFIPEGITPVQSLLGILVGGGSLYAVAMLGDWLFKKESMGGGDIKMVAMLGAFLGWQKVLFIFIAGAAIGLLGSILMLIISAKLRKERLIPFGPFLAMAAIVAIVYGDRIIYWYMSNFLNIH
jgi:leader peptidase (prepilin peptidase)/N-methyltransferase